jgi:hypothetical protein
MGLKILTVRKIFKGFKMSKFTFSFNDKSVVITDAKNNSESIELLDKLDTIDSLRAIGKEQHASIRASVGALSLLAEMLADARFDFYKGNTPINEKIPKEFNSALRDKISEYMKPAFIADMVAKGAKPATADNQWQIYSAGLNTGSFSNAKTWACKFYCQMGRLPVLDNGKLLPLRAIIKMLEDAKIPNTDNNGIADKLVKLSLDIEKRTEKTNLGDYVTAISALKSMLATYEGLYRESLETLTQLHSDGVIGKSDNVLSQIMDKPSVESLDAQYQNGQIDDITYQMLMLEHHNIEIVLED